MPYPSSRQSRIRSMSSENLSIKWKTLDRLVPPLKTICSLSDGSPKRCLRIQQTQKSFSTMAGFIPSRLADSPNKSRLSVADPAAILSMSILSGNLLDRVVDPPRHRLCIGQNLG